MNLRKIALLAVVCLLLTATGTQASYVTASSDYIVEETIFPIPQAWSVYGFDVLPSGNFVAFIDQDIVEISRTGVVSTPLYSFTDTLYGSFVKVWNDSIYFGESSTGSIWTIGLDGSNPINLGIVESNYDLAFNSQGQAFVSANPGWAGQKILMFDGSSTEIVTGLSGWSGPLAFDGSDNLVYATAYDFEGDSVLRFDAASVQQAIHGHPLVQSDATVLASISPPSYMVIDSADGIVYSSGNNLYRMLNGTSESIAGSEYFLTGLSYYNGGISVLGNGMMDGDQYIGVISTITPVPEPGALIGLAGFISLAGTRLVLRRRLR